MALGSVPSPSWSSWPRSSTLFVRRATTTMRIRAIALCLVLSSGCDRAQPRDAAPASVAPRPSAASPAPSRANPIRDSIVVRSVETVPADLETIVSGGHWSADSVDGTYRALIVSEGLEHVFSTLSVEWIADPRWADDGQSIVAARVIQARPLNIEPHRLLAPIIRTTKEGVVLRVLGVLPYGGRPGQVDTIEFALGAPGTVRPILSAKNRP